MKIFFNNLEPNDTIWVVYNKNYDEENATNELIITTGKIIENNIVERKIDISDFNDIISEYTVRKDYYMKISVKGLTNQYQRFYCDYYNNKCQMTMSPEFNDHGPYIEIFINKEDAKNYVVNRCERHINILIDQIKNNEQIIKVLENNINTAQNYE